MTTNPPRLATWLLRTFTSGPHAEAMAGDLVEQFRTRPSASWYWRQVISAVAADIISSAATHKWRTALAIAIGWVAYATLAVPANALWREIQPLTMDWLVRNGRYTPDWILWTTLLPRSFIVYVACAAVGFVTARASRATGLTAVCLFAATVFVVEYGLMAVLLASSDRPTMAAFTAWPAPAVFLIGRPISVVLGGLLGAKTAGTTRVASGL